MTNPARFRRRLSHAALLCSTLGAVGCAMRLPRTLDVRVTDDAVRVAETAAPGPSLVHLTNAGTRRHELRLVAFRQGISPDSGRALLAAGDVPDSLTEGSIAALSAPAGASAGPQLYLELLSGRVYGFVVQGSEGERRRYAVVLAQEAKRQ